MHVLGNKPNNETVDLYIKEIKGSRITILMKNRLYTIWIRHQMNLTTLFGRYQHILFHRVQAAISQSKTE